MYEMASETLKWGGGGCMGFYGKVISKKAIDRHNDNIIG